jgi:hypothetical protein
MICVIEYLKPLSFLLGQRCSSSCRGRYSNIAHYMENATATFLATSRVMIFFTTPAML